MKKHCKDICILGLLFTIFLLSACATMKGLGEDIEKVGEEIQEEADK